MNQNISRYVSKLPVTLMLLASNSLAFAQTSTEIAFFCSAEGTGIWGGQTVSLRFQTGALIVNMPQDSPTIAMYADEQDAVTFLMSASSGPSLSGDGTWNGVSAVDSSVRLTLQTWSDGRAVFTFNDWRNHNRQFVGTCSEPARLGRP